VLAQTPARIVSTSPSITETLFALGIGDRVVGVSTYCRYPAEALALPKVGTFLKPDAEIIARLKPELTIVNRGPSGIEQHLNALQLRFITVDPGTVESVFPTIRQIGEAAGVTPRAEALIASLEARLARVRTAVAGRSPTKVLIIVGRRTGTLTDLIGVSEKSYLGDLVRIAGGVNVLSGTLPAYPRISMETVVRLAPQVIVDAGDMGDTADQREARRTQTLALWRAQPLIPSTTRVFFAGSDAFVVPGPRIVDVAETFARWFHDAVP